MTYGHGDDTYRYADIRMNFSSNIFAHADLSALKTHLATRLDAIGNYPEPEPRQLENQLALRLGIPPECVMVTSGATDAIYLIGQAFANYKPVITQPTFSEYASATSHCHGQRKLHFICNPNNPTGTVTTPAIDADGLYVIDQAYENYTRQPLMTDNEAIRLGNVMLLHSMTKQYCVPGLRLGYVVAAQHLISRLRRFQRPWAVGALAIEAALFLVDHGIPNFPPIDQYLAETQRLRNWLNAIPGISIMPTQTTFMLGTVGPITAAQLKDHLATRHHILIRDASNFDGLTAHHFRIATQLPDENRALCAAIGEKLKS